MSIFAISDLHLGFDVDKPMDRFGPQWENHPEKIAQRWRAIVQPHDTVLVCGDTSWAMRLSEATTDLEFVHALPGRKILLRGNHDYWWSSLAKVRQALPSSMSPLQNDSLAVEGVQVAGSRGWLLPGPDSTPDDERIFQRELERLRLSLDSIAQPGPRLAMLHYPPFDLQQGTSAVVDLLRAHDVELCVYGHLHAMEPGTYPEGEIDGIEYHCVSVDLVDFTPRRLRPTAAPDAAAPGRRSS
jgi:predicted phosphohydrolase